MSSGELGIKYTLTGPDGTVATFNDPADANFVGYLTEITGLDGPEVRENFSLATEADGGEDGPYFHGRRSTTWEGLIPPDLAAGFEVTKNRLMRACNAMRPRGTATEIRDADPNVPTPASGNCVMAWTNSQAGAIRQQVAGRRSMRPTITGRRPRNFLFGIGCKNPRILSATPSTLAAATSLSIANAGNMSSNVLKLTIASPGATIAIANTTTGETLTLLGLSGGGTVTVDFAKRLVLQGGVAKRGAVAYPSSVWWELIPGTNAVTITNAATPTWRDAWVG